MKHWLATLALTLGTAASAADAPADTPMAACNADVARLCPGIAPGEGRIKACVKEKRSELSPECKKELAQAYRKKKQAGS